MVRRLHIREYRDKWVSREPKLSAGRIPLRRALLWSWISGLALSAALWSGPRPRRHDSSAESEAPQPRMLRQHFILALAISPDGQWIAVNLGRSTGRDEAWGTTWLSNLTNGATRLINPGPTGDGFALEFSPDSRMLALGTVTGGNSGAYSYKNSHFAVQLWDVSSGIQLNGFWTDVCTPLRSWTCAAHFVEFSPDGKYISAATAWSDTLTLPVFYDPHNSLRLWDRQSGAPLKLSKSFHGSIGGLAFSPDSAELAIAHNKNVSIYDLREGKQVYLYKCGDYCFRPQFSQTGKFLAAVDRHGRIYAWDVQSGKKLPSPQVQTPVSGRDSSRLCFVGETLVAAGTDNKMHLFEMPSGQETRSLEFSKGLPYWFSFTPDGRSIVGAGPEVNPVIHMWNATTGQELRHWDLTAVLNEGAR